MHDVTRGGETRDRGWPFGRAERSGILIDQGRAPISAQAKSVRTMNDRYLMLLKNATAHTQFTVFIVQKGR